jgi:hypothetical protein
MTATLDAAPQAAKTVLSLVTGHPAAAAVAAAAALAAAFMTWRAARRIILGARSALRGQPAEDLLTMAAAGLATAVAMNGMWRFFGTVLHFSGAERITMFAFLEVAVLAAAFRARRNMRSFGSAGAEGLAVWVLSGLSAMFAALDARSAAEAAFRLAPPLVAAWLWERGLRLERRKTDGRSVYWRLSAERVLVWLRLAEPSARAAGDVDAHRRIARLARAAKRLRELRAAGARPWRQHRALRRLDKAMEGAVEHAALASDPDRQDQMHAQIGALNAAETLAAGAGESPWDRRAARLAQEAQDRDVWDQAHAVVSAAQKDRQEALAGQEAAEDRVRELQTQAAELGPLRTRITELTEALARADDDAEARPREVDRQALVAELAGEIRMAAADGDKWHPDYDALMERTGRQRRWCEYLVRDARLAVFGSAGVTGRATGPAYTGSRADGDAEPASGRADALELAGAQGGLS